MNGRDRYWHGWYQHESGLWQEWHWDGAQWRQQAATNAWYDQWSGRRGRTWEEDDDWEMAEASDSEAAPEGTEDPWADPDEADAFELAEIRRDQADHAARSAVAEGADAAQSAAAENPQKDAGQRFDGSLLNGAYNRF